MLPLAEGAHFELPFYQYDKGFGRFTIDVVGSEDVAGRARGLSRPIPAAGARHAI